MRAAFEGTWERVSVHLPATGWTVASGDVVHCQPHRGFGMRFLNLTTDAEQALAQAVDHLRANG